MKSGGTDAQRYTAGKWWSPEPKPGGQHPSPLLYHHTTVLPQNSGQHLLVPGIILDTKDAVENKIQTASAKRFHSYGRDGT